jgi:pimeloyl-ACP methyl ester carboxylesterase
VGLTSQSERVLQLAPTPPVPAEHSFAIAQKAPRAKLVLYPDAGHAFLFQYAEDFCAEVLRFTV